MKAMLLFVLTFLVFDLQSHTKNKAGKFIKQSKHCVEQLQQQDVIIVEKKRRGPHQTERRQSTFLPLLQRQSQHEIDFELRVLQDLERATTTEKKQVVKHLEEKKSAEFLARYIFSTCDKQNNKVLMELLNQHIQRKVAKYPSLLKDSYLGTCLYVDGRDIPLRNSPSLLDIAYETEHIPALASLMTAFVYSDDK